MFAAASVAQRAIAFLLLPVYTAALTPAEYGRLGLLITIQGGMSILLAAGMEAAVLRQFFQLGDDPGAQRRFVMSIWRVMLWSAPTIAAVVALLLLELAPASDVFRPGEAAIAVLGSAAFVAATTVPLTVLRAEQRLRDYLIVTAVSGLSTTVLTVGAVVVLDFGVVGWLWAFLIANCMTFLAALVLLPWRRLSGFDRPGVRSALTLGLPLIPHAAAQWSLQLADRIVLAALVSATALGVYTLGANIAIPALVVLQSLNYGFLPGYARHEGSDGTELRATIALQVTLTFAVCAALASLGAPGVALISPAYEGASELVPWLVFGYLFLGLYYIPMNGISLILGRTTFVWTLTVSAAAVNLGLTFLLVPEYGIVMAAVAAAAGYAALFVAVTVYAAAIGVRLPIDWNRTLRVVIVFVTTYVVSVLLTPGGTGVADLLVRAAVLSTLLVTVPVANGHGPGHLFRMGGSLVRGRFV